jgi:hypothetical protein
LTFFCILYFCFKLKRLLLLFFDRFGMAAIGVRLHANQRGVEGGAVLPQLWITKQVLAQRMTCCLHASIQG